MKEAGLSIFRLPPRETSAMPFSIPGFKIGAGNGPSAQEAPPTRSQRTEASGGRGSYISEVPKNLLAGKKYAKNS